MSTITASAGVRWEFNGDRSDLSQVTPFVDAYWALRDQITKSGRYPTHQDFRGSIPGLEHVERWETPIYLLAGLHHLVQGCDEEAALRSDGYELVEEMPPASRTRFAQLAVFDWSYVGPGAHQRSNHREARLVAGPDGRPQFILPHGKRTRGHRLAAGARVYGKR